jgi:hypothetical protein
MIGRSKSNREMGIFASGLCGATKLYKNEFWAEIIVLGNCYGEEFSECTNS